MQHWNIRIHGAVQGVFYRDSARQKAEELGVSGFARNESDGSVYIEAEGTEQNLKAFLAWCTQGPASAQVEKVKSEHSANLKHFSEFRIL